jgi:pimeloyl-ACP methyl ester carboxylesterase
MDPAVAYAETVSQNALDYREGYFQDGPQRLHFVEAGNGPLIILYHGFPSYWLSWREQFEAFAPHYRVIAVDGLGAGLSSKPEDLNLYKAEALAAQLDRFAHAIAPNEKFILIGHDWGSVLSLAYAQSRPERLHGVVGMSAPPLNNLLAQLTNNPKQQENSAYMQRFKQTTRADIEATDMATRVAQQSYARLEKSGELSAREIELFHQSVGRIEAVDSGMNWYRANIPSWDDIDDASQWPGADVRLKIPALYIHGKKDPIFRPEVLDAMLEAEPMMEIVRLPGIGHWTSMEKPELSNDAIRTFIEKTQVK